MKWEEDNIYDKTMGRPYKTQIAKLEHGTITLKHRMDVNGNWRRYPHVEISVDLFTDLGFSDVDAPFRDARGRLRDGYYEYVTRFVLDSSARFDNLRETQEPSMTNKFPTWKAEVVSVSYATEDQPDKTFFKFKSGPHIRPGGFYDGVIVGQIVAGEGTEIWVRPSADKGWEWGPEEEPQFAVNVETITPEDRRLLQALAWAVYKYNGYEFLRDAVRAHERRFGKLR
jgi:hypothetical protein